MCRRDIFVVADQVLIYIKWSKTIQSGKRYVLVTLIKIPGSPLCTYTAVKTMLEKVPVPTAGPALLVPSSSGLVSLTHCSFTKCLRQILVRPGHNSQGFLGHSFQCRGASFALSCRVSGQLIKKSLGLEVTVLFSLFRLLSSRQSTGFFYHGSSPKVLVTTCTVVRAWRVG